MRRTGPDRHTARVPPTVQARPSISAVHIATPGSTRTAPAVLPGELHEPLRRAPPQTCFAIGIGVLLQAVSEILVHGFTSLKGVQARPFARPLPTSARRPPLDTDFVGAPATGTLGGHSRQSLSDMDERKQCAQSKAPPRGGEDSELLRKCRTRLTMRTKSTGCVVDAPVTGPEYSHSRCLGGDCRIAWRRWAVSRGQAWPWH